MHHWDDVLSYTLPFVACDLVAHKMIHDKLQYRLIAVVHTGSRQYTRL